MPVLYNNSTGLAENLPQQQADAALQAKTHEIPFIDQQGQPFSGSLEDMPSLLEQGYRQPHPEHLQQLLTHAQYSTPVEQAKAGLEGAAEAATFGLSPLVERAAGVTPEAMQGRAEANPGTKELGKAASLAAQMLTGVGEGKLLLGLGEGMQAATGLGSSTAIRRMAGAAVRQATEMAVMQTGDEVAKAFIQDPNQSMESAIANVGLSATLGGAFGLGGKAAGEALYAAKQGSQVAKILDMMRDKSVGHETANIAAEAAQQAGIELTPEIKAAVSGNAAAKEMAQTLEASGSKAGAQYRASLEQVKQHGQEAVLSSLGKTEGDLAALPSEYDLGTKLRDNLAKDLKENVGPVSDKFEKVKAKFSTVEVPASSLDEAGEKLSKLIVDEGYGLRSDSPAAKEIGKVVSDLKNIKTLEDLRKFQSVVRDELYSINIPGLPRKVGGVLRDTEENVLNSLLGKEAPELAAEHSAARSEYKRIMENIDSLNDRLHVGKYWGPDSFIKALGEMSPEDVMRRLKGTNDVDGLKLLSEISPSSTNLVKDYHVGQLLNKASARMPEGINTKTFFSALEKMSPELRSFVLSPEQAGTLGGVHDLLSKLPERINPSGTARALDKLWKYVPGGATSMVGMLFGHNPVTGYVLGSLGQYVGREAPDALRLAALRSIGSDVATNPAAFRSMAKVINSSYKAAQTLEKASGAIFLSGTSAAKDALSASPKSLEKLDKIMKVAATDPTSQQDHTASVGHYMPDHAIAMGSVYGRALGVVAGDRPQTESKGILDMAVGPPRERVSQYERTLHLVDKPMSILQHIKDGTITPKDMATVSQVYPALYKQMQAKVSEKMIEAKADNVQIPYKARLGLSAFLGVPLDSSISPQSIVSNQMVFQAKQQQPNKPPPQGSNKAMNQMIQSAQTPGQAREAHRASTRK